MSINKNLGALLAVALSTAGVFAAGTDTWVGNTDANWSTAANWTTSGGSTPPASGDSLMFGAAGTSGTSLNNDISGLSIYNLSFGGSASAFTFGGNAVTFGGGLTNAGSANQTFGSGVVIAGGAATTVENAGSGTLALGSLTQAAGDFGTVDFTTNSTGAINTTTPNVNGILGGWATVSDNVSSGTVGGWAAVDGSGNFVPYTGYASGVPSGVTNTSNYKGGNATISANATVNSYVDDGSGDVTINSGVTLTLSSGGLFIGGTQRWLKAGNSSSTIKSGLATGELYLHCNNATFNDFEIQPNIADGSVATTVIKDGPGALKFASNSKAYTGGTIVSGGTLQLSTGGGTACIQKMLTINPGTKVSLTSGDNLGYNSGQCTTPIDINGGTLDNAYNGNNGYLSTFNLTGGTMSSSGGGAYNFNGSSSALNSLATNVVSTISGPILLRGDNLSINTAQGTVPGGIDLIISGAISGGNPFSKDGAGTLALTATNSASGMVTINSGTLQLGDGTSRNGTLAGNITDNATLVFANPNPQSYAGVISGGGSFIKKGVGTLTLSGANSYSGATTVSNGVLLVGAPQSGNGTVAVMDGATLGVAASSSLAYWSPSSLTIGSSTGATLQFGVVSTTTAPLASSAITINGTATVNITGCPAVMASYPLFSGYSSGSVVLGSQPTGFFGQLTISGSTVYYQVTNLVVDTWTAAVNTNWDTVTANWTNSVDGNLYVSGYPVQFNDSANGTTPLLVNITNPVSPASIVVSNTAKSYTIGGLAISGSASLTKNGNNTLTLTGTNSFTGPMTISAGTVAVGGPGQLGAGNYTATIANDGRFNYNSSANQSLTGIISGSGSLAASGGSVIALGGLNAYSGGSGISNSIVLAGLTGWNNVPVNGAGNTVDANEQAAFGSGSVTVSTNGVLQMGYRASNTGIAYTIPNDIVLNGGAVWANDAYQHLSGSITVNSAGGFLGSTYSGGSGAYGPASGNNKGLFLDGLVGGSGPLTIEQAGAGGNGAVAEANGWGNAAGNSYNVGIVMFLNNANTYSGTVTVYPYSSGGGNYLCVNGPTVLQYATINLVSNNTGSTKLYGTSPLTFLTGLGSVTLGALAGNADVVLTGRNEGNGSSGNDAIALSVGGNNASTTYSGVLSGAGTLTKAGNGTLVLSGPSSYTAGTTLSSGIVNLGVAQNGATSGPLGASGAITFAGGTLQYGVSNQFDYSPRFANSTGPISIDLNGTNVTFASAIAGSNTNGLALTNSTGTGTLTLTGANNYTGDTIINGGALALSGSGSINASSKIRVVSGATFDVSGVTFTLGSGQTLSGSGTVTGAVTTASITSMITPGGANMVGTLTFKNNLNLGSGASPVFDLSTSHSSGNDQMMIAGNLTLNSSDAINVNALSGSANLDQTGDYVLFSVTGTLSMASQPSLAFDNTPPANAANYSIKASGNNVVLHYSASTSPVVASVVVTNATDGTATAVRGQPVTVYATVTPGNGTITNVSANLSLLGGSSSQVLTALGGNNYSYTFIVAPNATLGADLINVTATDTTPLSGSGAATLTVNVSEDVWNGLASDANWSSGSNWVSTFPPGYAGDTLDFAGNTQTSPNMDANYSVAGLIFDSSASSFTLGAAPGNVLTLTGGVTNQSGSLQTLNLPVVLSGTQVIDDPNSAGVTLDGNISGSGGLTFDINSSGSYLLSGTNTYTGNTTLSSLFGTLVLRSSSAIPSGNGKGNVSLAGKLDLNGNNASMNGLNGAGTVDNSSANPVMLSIGNDDAASTLTGGIQNSGGGALTLIKVGTNSLTLPTASSYSGGTMLVGGAITLPNGSVNSFGSGAFTISNATLVAQPGNGNAFNSGNSVYLGNEVVVPAGTFNVIDNSANNYGNLWVGGDTGLWTGSGTVNFQNNGNVNGSAVLWNGNPLQNFQGTISIGSGKSASGGNFNGIAYNSSAGGGTGTSVATFDAHNVAWVFGGKLSILTQVEDQNCTTVRMGSLAGTNSNSNIRGNGSSSNPVTYEVGALNTSTTYAGTISDWGSAGTCLTKVGSGALTLSGASTYTGLTTVSNGTLDVSSAQTGGGAFVVADGATLGISGSESLKISSLTLGSGNGCTNNFNGVTSTTAAAITNTGALTLAGTVTVNARGNLSVGQYPLISSAGGISGSGGFVLGPLPTGAAATIITNGNTIVLNVTAAPFAQTWTGAVSTNWDFVTTNWSAGGNPVLYSDAQAAIFDDTATQTTANVTTNVSPVSIFVTNNAENYTFASSGGAKITGSTSITKAGNGTLTMLGMSNDFTGGFIVNGGTVSIDGSANLGNGMVDLQGTLNPVQGFNLGSTLAIGPVSGNGTGTINVGSGITLTNNTGMVNYGPGTGTLVKTGSGTLQLGGYSTYSGSTVVSNGTLVLTTGGGAGTVRGALTIKAGATVQTIVQDALGYNGGQCATPINIYGGALTNSSGANEAYISTFNLMGGSMSSSGGAYNFNGSSSGLNSLATNAVSTVSAPILLRSGGLSINTAEGTVPGGIDLTISGVISGGSNGFEKDGAGTLELTGANTYSGTTTVAAGKLRVDGIGTIPGPVNVNSGATLEGNGTIGGAVSVGAGGTLAPAPAGIGTLTVNNNLTLSGNTLVKLDKSLSPAQSNDILNVTGNLTYGGTLTLTNIGPALIAGDTFRVFPPGGAGSLSLSGNAGSGLAFSFSDGVVSVVAAEKPAPHITSFGISGTTLTITATNGVVNGQYILLQSTNVALPLIQWTPVLTNTFDGNGDINLSTNIANPASTQSFYILEQ